MSRGRPRTHALPSIGDRFGRLTVVGVNPRSMIDVRCDCGNEKSMLFPRLYRGNTSSCGCLQIELTKKLHKKHDGKGTPEYRTWKHMTQRVFNERDADYANYGARGITVCDRWKNSFVSFLEDMGPRPGPEYSIDRKENNLGYCKENCRWATKVEQNRNRRSNRVVLFRGEVMPLVVAVENVGAKYFTVVNRLNKGWSVEDALTLPPCSKEERLARSRVSIEKKKMANTVE